MINSEVEAGRYTSASEFIRKRVFQVIEMADTH